MSASPLEIGTLLLQLGTIAVLYVKVQSAIRAIVGKGESREITNNPLYTQDNPRPATIEDVQREAKRITTLEKRLDSHIRENSTEMHDLAESVTDLRDRMDDRFQSVTDELRELSRAVGRLEGK